jgi:hypothetical protein
MGCGWVWVLMVAVGVDGLWLGSGVDGCRGWVQVLMVVVGVDGCRGC